MKTKKQYIIPSAKMIIINPNSILADSDPINVPGPSEETPEEYGAKGTIWQWMDEEN